MRGRPPRPREEKVRTGKTRNLPEVVRVSGRAELAEIAEPPAHLGKDAAQWWREVAPVLAEAGVLEKIDRYVLAMAAESYGDVLRMNRVIHEKGMFTTGSVGNIVEAPWVKVRRDAMAMFERYLNHVALSPVSRARLGLAHLTGRALMKEMDDAIGGLDDPATIDADVIEDEDLDAVGLPGA
jgi:P27 family predicted phage terminase small subunit